MAVSFTESDLNRIVSSVSIYKQQVTQRAAKAISKALKLFRGSRKKTVSFTESDLNQIFSSLFDSEVFIYKQQVTHGAAKAILKALQLFRKPLELKSSLTFQVRLTEEPHFTISGEDGVTVNSRAKVQVFTEKEEELLSVSAWLNVTMKVGIKDQTLALLSHQVSVTIVTQNKFRGALVKPLEAVVRRAIMGLIDKYLQILLPNHEVFTEGTIHYDDGLVTISGKPDATMAAVKMFKSKSKQRGLRKWF